MDLLLRAFFDVPAFRIYVSVPDDGSEPGSAKLPSDECVQNGIHNGLPVPNADDQSH